MSDEHLPRQDSTMNKAVAKFEQQWLATRAEVEKLPADKVLHEFVRIMDGLVETLKQPEEAP